ncbi:polyprenyl synthetase family protein [Stetteria hydrogenophila]
MTAGVLWRLLGEVASRVDEYIYNTVKGRPEYLYEAALHLIRAGGKRLRPALVVLTARLLGGGEAGEAALPLAAAVEVFHNFTLIHDDIMDRDEFRRGVPTVHAKYGLETAILAGDLLHAESFRSIAYSGLPPELTVRAARTLADAAKKVCEGQALDMSFEERLDVTPEEYLEMIYLKTGALIEASTRLGAIAAGAPVEVEERAGVYGARVGVAFQIRDDILGLYGDPARTGKPVFNDLREGKKTLLVLYALRNLPGDEAERVRSVLGRRASEDEYREAAELIRKSGALDYAQRLAESLVREALEALDSLPARDEEAREALRELAWFAVKRDK